MVCRIVDGLATTLLGIATRVGLQTRVHRLPRFNWMDRTPTSARLGGDHHAPSLFHAACSGAFLDVGGAPLDLALDIHHALAAHVCTVMLRVLLGACGRMATVK